ncbi:MAG: GTPase ObgE [Chloroflexi bacterium]|nr:GTPase ObgE [Chloroflexota bacterium]
MFLDEATITVISGKGGDGVVHFRREKYVPFGGPDGGDGGRGGDVVLEVEPRLNTLTAFRHQTRFRAQDGARGAKQNMTGHSGESLVIKIPAGTVVYEAAGGETLGDLIAPGQTMLVAKGGQGGRGNTHFANSRNQTPRTAEKGEPAEQKTLRLELKLIADIGIVGAPNAGKSTLLASVTHAKPKIAPYPFTTLEPNLGVAELDEDTTLVLADIPGLIEGAHLGLGLGHSFLRHIQRTRVLIHLLDATAEEPFLDFAQINSELALFDPRLAEKPQVVALNKMDMPEAIQAWPRLEAMFKKKGYEVHSISALSGENVRTLLYRAYQLLEEAPPPVEVAEMPVYKPALDPKAYTIHQEGEGWRVSGQAIERAASRTYWEYDQSIERFQHILKTLGIEDALRKAGVQEGDTVTIGDFELEWRD